MNLNIQGDFQICISAPLNTLGKHFSRILWKFYEYLLKENDTVDSKLSEHDKGKIKNSELKTSPQ